MRDRDVRCLARSACRDVLAWARDGGRGSCPQRRLLFGRPGPRAWTLAGIRASAGRGASGGRCRDGAARARSSRTAAAAATKAAPTAIKVIWQSAVPPAVTTRTVVAGTGATGSPAVSAYRYRRREGGQDDGGRGQQAVGDRGQDRGELPQPRTRLACSVRGAGLWRGGYSNMIVS